MKLVIIAAILFAAGHKEYVHPEKKEVCAQPKKPTVKGEPKEAGKEVCPAGTPSPEKSRPLVKGN